MNFSLFHLFINASLVVQLITLFLIILSIISWSITINQWRLLKSFKQANLEIESYIREEKGLKFIFQLTCFNPGTALEHNFNSIINQLIGKEGDGKNAENNIDFLLAKDVYALRNNLGLLSSIAANSPFLGLFGTVWGITDSFIGIASEKSINLAVVAPGIAEALIATALGLVVAIPATWFYNLFQTEIDNYESHTHILTNELIDLINQDIKSLDLKDGDDYENGKKHKKKK